MDRLEKRVIELEPETKHIAVASDLYVLGYDPFGRGDFRKHIMGDLYLVYRLRDDGINFRFARIEAFDVPPPQNDYANADGVEGLV